MPAAIVLDANIYRALTDEVCERICDAERRSDIAALADPWVIIELLSHLNQPADHDYWPCRRAVRRLHRRCLDDRPGDLHVIVDAQSQITKLLFGEALLDRALTLVELTDGCGTVAEATDDDRLPSLAALFDRLAEHVRHAEERFSGKLAQLLEALQRVAGAAGDYRTAARRFLRSEDMVRLDATILLRRAYDNTCRPVPDALPESEVAKVSEACRQGSRAAALALERVLCDGAALDKSSTRNLLWDQEIAMSIGQRVRGRDLVFVTEDRYFKQAAASEGHADHVWSCGQYLEHLNVAA